MSILVTGSSGTVGSEVVRQLAARGADVRALSRSPERADLPAGVTPVKGDMLDPASLRSAVAGVRTLFLLNAVSSSELNESLTTLGLAMEAGVRNVVYLSVIHAERFTDVPHFASKAAVERMIADVGIAATILRPGYYIQNDSALRGPIADHGVYPPGLGTAGVLMVDVRDLAEVGAVELMRRDRSNSPLPSETLDVIEPETFTGPRLADVWAEVLGRDVRYGGDDINAQERGFLELMPGWMAYDMRLMMRRFQTDGMVAAPSTDLRLREKLGRPMRTYREFATETAAGWLSAR